MLSFFLDEKRKMIFELEMFMKETCDMEVSANGSNFYATTVSSSGVKERSGAFKNSCLKDTLV